MLVILFVVILRCKGTKKTFGSHSIIEVFFMIEPHSAFSLKDQPYTPYVFIPYLHIGHSFFTYCHTLFTFEAKII